MGIGEGGGGDREGRSGIGEGGGGDREGRRWGRGGEEMG